MWVGLASLAHPCVQDGMTETEALGATLAAPPPPAPLGPQGATRPEPRSSFALGSPAPPPPQGAPKRPPWATPAQRPLEPPRRAPQGAAPVAPLQAHCPHLPEPSAGSSMSKGGGVREQAVVLGELQETRGNVESLHRRVKKWAGKLAECRGRGDLTGGGNASERVLEGNRRVREAQKAVEVHEKELQGMGGGWQVAARGGGSTTMRLWSWVTWWCMRRMKSGGLTRGLRERKKRGGGGRGGGGGGG